MDEDEDGDMLLSRKITLGILVTNEHAVAC